MKPDTRELLTTRRLQSTPRKDRPRCGAKTRKGTPCQAQALANGRCKYHGGLSTGPQKGGAGALREEWLKRQNFTNGPFGGDGTHAD